MGTLVTSMWNLKVICTNFDIFLIRRADMTQDECQRLVKKALAHAMARDGSSGGIIRTVTITENDVVREYTSGDDM